MYRKIKRLKYILKILINDAKYTLSFLKSYDSDQEVIFSKLRTNAHILDKGLNIIPFEKGHSKTIYKECINLKEKLYDNDILSDESYKWASAVIEKYVQKQKGIDLESPQSIYRKFSVEERQLFYSIIKSRTSCRNYSNNTIPNEIWNDIIFIAEHAPSGCCRQPSRYYIESNQDKILELIKNIAGATAFSSPIPYLICATTDTRAFNIIDRYAPIIDTSLSIQNFLLACTANNISTTPLNWQHATNRQNKAVKEILNIPEYEKIVLFISAGYPYVVPHKPDRINTKRIRKK